MYELQMRCVKSDTSNSPLRHFCRMVFSVADDRVADGGKLHADLILQSRDQRNPDERSGAQRTLDRVPKFSASRLRIGLLRCPLKHTFFSKIVNERPFLGVRMSPNDCKILPRRGMGEKLSNQRLPIRLGDRKEQNPGGKSIDAMDDKDSSSGRFQFCAKHRQGGLSIRIRNRHRRKPCRFIDGHDRVVSVKHGNAPRKTRRTTIAWLPHSG